MKKINIIGFGKMGMQISSLLMIMGYQVNIFTENFLLKEKKFIISNKILKNFLKSNNLENMSYLKILKIYLKIIPLKFL